MKEKKKKKDDENVGEDWLPRMALFAGFKYLELRRAKETYLVSLPGNDVLC